MEAMDYETVRCGPLMTKAFVEHIRENQKKLAAKGPSGEESLVELQALEEWVMVARERQSEREDNKRRAAAVEANGGEAGAVKAENKASAAARKPPMTSLRTKSTPVFNVQFTGRNLLMAMGARAPSVRYQAAA